MRFKVGFLQQTLRLIRRCTERFPIAKDGDFLSRLSSCSDDSLQQGVDAFNFLRVAMCDDVPSCVVLLEEGQAITYTVDIYMYIFYLLTYMCL